MAYDATRGRVVLFGGLDGNFRNDTWEWDGSTWSELSPPGSPSPRYGHAMAYNSVRGRVILFGGNDGRDCDDTWEWDGSTWSELSPPGSPSPRSGHAMAYNSARGRIVLFGGWDGIRRRNDTWEWDGSTWTELSPPGSPSPRTGHAMAYDVARDRVVLFGGNDAIFLAAIRGSGMGARGLNSRRQARPRLGMNTRWPTTRPLGRVVLFAGYGSFRNDTLGVGWEHVV